VAIGLASGFIEPLESTSIHLIQNSIMWLLLMFPDQGITATVRDAYNAKLRSEAEHIRDFIILHYHLNERHGDPLWDYLRNMEIPDTLQQRMSLFRETGRVFKPQDDVFAENSWVQVMMGQGLVPASYHNIADALSREQLAGMMQQIAGQVRGHVAKLPAHGDFVSHYARQ
jgi:tryptophan halogenase